MHPVQGRQTISLRKGADAEATALGDEEPPGTSGKQFLADLTGRRALPAALVLLGAYLVPVLVAWGIAKASEASLLGDSVWLAPTLALTLGLGLVVGLTIRFGGWFQAVSFGEEYMLSFRPVAGYALAWWRFAVQLGAFIVVALIGADAEDEVTLQEISNAETAALPAYAERAPIPEGWEQFSDSLSQSEYEERPNATYRVDYIVPASYGLGDVRTWLREPAWTDGVEGMPPFGALREIECDEESVQCEAQVTPPDGETVEYHVEISIDEVGVDQDGEVVPAGRLRLEVEYQQHDSR